jgi:hypothetical protein
MRYELVEEVWSIWTNGAEAKILRSSPPTDAGEKAAMEKRAEESASKFEKHGYEGNARYPYWWGRNEDQRISHRFVVKPSNSQAASSDHDATGESDIKSEADILLRAATKTYPGGEEGNAADETAFGAHRGQGRIVPYGSGYATSTPADGEATGSVPLEFNTGTPPPSGTTVIVPPQEQPPPTVGISAGMRGAVQGRATLTVTFADGEAVKQWLDGQSPDIALVFAARAALRVIPTITFGSWPGGGRKTTREIAGIPRCCGGMGCGGISRPAQSTS